MKKISVSLLSADFSNLSSEILKIEACNLVNNLHFDVMDGIFVPNISFGFPILGAVKKLTDMPISAHLMISDPLQYLGKFIDFGVSEVFVHLNHDKDYLLQMADMCRKSKVNFGIAINPNEEINSFVHEILFVVDSVLIMSVYPGFAGQKFIPSVLSKINTLRSLNITKKIDGGISLDIFNYARNAYNFDDLPDSFQNEKYIENLKYIDEFVMGSYFFKNIDKFINK